MRFTSIKRLYLPALSIIAVVVLMLVIISVSTYRNLRRQQQTALTFLTHQGQGLLNSLEAAIRSGMMMPIWEEDDLDLVIRETARNTEIVYIYIVNAQGKIVHHTNFELEGGVSSWTPQFDDERQTKSRMIGLPDGIPVFEVAKKFSPFSIEADTLYQSPMVMDHHRNFKGFHEGETIVLGLDMTPFKSASRSDLYHALIMGIVIFTLGSGTLFFIFVIQNYYLAERTLKQTRDYARQVVASIANGLLSIDNEGKIVSYNNQALNLLDIKEQDIKQMDLSRVFDFKETGIHETLTNNTPVLEKEIHLSRGNEKELALTLSVSPICDEKGSCDGAVIILRDLTEIKFLEEKVRRAEKLAAVGKLAASVAHEIRNPLSSIKGYAQFFKYKLKDRPQEHAYADTIVKEVDRINNVVTNLLNFARPMKTEIAPTNVDELISHVVMLVKKEAEQHDVVIKIRSTLELNSALMDGGQITQALLNLLLNSLQALPPGGTIEVGANRINSGESLHLWVKDNGPGIPYEIHNKIFEPFFTTGEDGTGLGLAIVQKIVENHNGRVTFESPTPDRMNGSCFSMILPLKIHNISSNDDL